MTAVLAFVCLLHLPFLGGAYHLDEPFYLAVARQILRAPLDPFGFHYNWYGFLVPMRRLNTEAPLVAYCLALGLRLTGGSEAAMRLFFLPLDLAAAAALYLLAGRFLKRPLLPVLAALASPAYFLGTRPLMLEKWTAALGFWGLYALARGLEEGRPIWRNASAALIAPALLAKSSAVFLLPTAAVYAQLKGLPPRRLAALLLAAAAPAALLLLWSKASGSGSSDLLLEFLLFGLRGGASPWGHKLRAFFAFAGGCAPAPAAYALALLASGPRRNRLALLGCVAAALFLFSPLLDASAPRPADRWLGGALAFGGLASCAALALGAGAGRGSCSSRPVPGDMPEPGAGRALCLPWLLSVSVLQLLAYWSVVSRYMLFLVPPLVLGLAAELESRLEDAPLLRLELAALAISLPLTLGLAWVEQRYAGAQRALAGALMEGYSAQGRKVWFAGHWGLQHYMERAGAEALDAGRGGWSLPRPGDMVLVPKVNANVLTPDRERSARRRVLKVPCAVPLRLMSGPGEGQAGFYSSAWGFLPFAFSRAPVDEFAVFELL